MKTICCEQFKNNISEFHWMRLEDDKDTILMPHLWDGDKRIRVEYCPFCGSYIRDIRINQKQIIK
jgi:hypothetical protein